MPSWMWMIPALAALVLWLVGRKPAQGAAPTLTQSASPQNASAAGAKAEPVYDPDDEADARAERRSLRPGDRA